MHNDLYQYLSGNTGISAIFSDRIFHMSLPQSVTTYPALTFQLISRTPLWPDLEEPNDFKVDSSLYQFDVIATSSGDAVAAADSFDSIFRNFRGTMGSTRVQWVGLQNIQHLEDRDGDKLRRRIILDYSITFDV